MNQAAGVADSSDLKVRQRQIVAIAVGRRIDSLGLFKKRRGRGDLANLYVKLSQVVIRIEGLRLQCNRPAKVLFGCSKFSKAYKIGSEICSCGRRIRLQSYSFFQVLTGFGLLLLRGIDQSE